jgi:asparagine synthase (glutamine-hydrolysing)
VRADEVLAMADVITHRGPDDLGCYVDEQVGLAMRRLRIIDLTTGKQPIHNEDQTVWVILNGEIYNYREQQQELAARGHRFYTASDTEVIAHLYEEYGADCVQHLRGMFAFAVWDTRSRTLLLARDRLGIKPLYYGTFGRRLAFGSEIKCLLTLPEVERCLDHAAIRHLVTFLATPPDRSILAGIRKLEPGHVLVSEQGKDAVVRRYWDLDFEPATSRSEGAIVEELRACLRETVDLHMISDVPLGAFLSGGVDSSAVVATMSQLSNRPVKTFAIGFDEDDYNELDHARRVSRHLGTEHRELVLEPDVFGVLDDLVWYLDEPFGDSSAIPTYMVSKLAAEEVTVVLSGDGGDEVFAGYDNYAAEGRERRWDALPRAAKVLSGWASRLIPEERPGRAFLSHHAMSGADRYLDSVSYFREEQHRRMFTPQALELTGGYDPWAGQRRALERHPQDWLFALQYADFNHYLPLDILTKVDRMSMAHSIETRVPLLDHVFVETAARIPSDLKLRNGRRKHIFKEAMRDILPDAILDRRKQGFAVPLDRWFRGRLESYVNEVLLGPRAVQRGIFEPDFVRRLVAHNNRGRQLGSQLWTLISFELWCRRFLDRPVGDARPERSAEALSAAVTQRT